MSSQNRQIIQRYGEKSGLGAIGARAGGANILRGTARVTFWGALAMALTAGIGKLFGTVV